MSDSGRVARNTIANWVGTAVNTIVFFFLLRYLVDALGRERVGIYAVARDVLVYLNLLTLGMSGAVTRFAARDIAAENLDGLNTTLSTIALFYLAIGMLGAGVCAFLGVLARHFFEINPAYSAETFGLFLAVGVAFLVRSLCFPYSGVLQGHHRFDLLNGGTILLDVSRAGGILLLFAVGWISLGSVGAAITSGTLLLLLYSWIVSRRVHPGLSVDPRRATRDAAREVFGFSTWNAMVQVGNVIAFATPTIIVARALGPEQVLFYAIPFQLANRLRMLVAGMASTLAPMAAGTLASGDRERFRTLMVRGTRAAATLCLPIGAILLVFAGPFLTLWMGPDFAWTGMVYGILMISMFGRISHAAVLHVLIGGGHLRGLAWVQLGSALAMMALIAALLAWTDLGILAVAIGFTVTLFLSHSVYLPWYAARQMRMSVGHFLLASYLRPVLSTLPGLAVGLLLARSWPPTTWAALIAEFGIALGASAVPAWYVCFTPSTRERLLRSFGIR